MEKLIAKIVEKILEQMSDNMREELIVLIKRLDTVAEESENPWDDILVLVLKVIVGVE